MNVWRVVAIGGLTFCTTLISTGFDAPSSIINAVLVSGIALFTEMKLESENFTAIQKKISVGLVL